MKKTLLERYKSKLAVILLIFLAPFLLFSCTFRLFITFFCAWYNGNWSHILNLHFFDELYDPSDRETQSWFFILFHKKKRLNSYSLDKCTSNPLSDCPPSPITQLQCKCQVILQKKLKFSFNLLFERWYKQVYEESIWTKYSLLCLSFIEEWWPNN